MRTILATLLCATALFAADDNVNRRAPGFSLPDSAGQQRDLADFRGKWVVLEIMQTTCPHCAEFTEILSQAQKKYGSKLAVIAIVTPPDTPAQVKQYIAGHGVTYPILFDCGQAAFSYARTGAFDIPQVFLIDPSGMIRKTFGYSVLTREFFSGKGLFTELDQLMAAPTLAPKK